MLIKLSQQKNNIEVKTPQVVKSIAKKVVKQLPIVSKNIITPKATQPLTSTTKVAENRNKIKSNLNAEYLYRLAIAYLGNGKYSLAFDLMQEAADLGFAVAQNDVASMYRNGMGVDINLRNAYKFAQLAVENGYLPANQTLALIKNDINKFNRFK